MPTEEKVDETTRLSVGQGDAMKYARVEVTGEQCDQISRVGTTQMESHVEQRTSHLNGTLRLDEVIDAEKVKLFLDRGSGISSISEGLVAGGQGTVSGVQLTRPFVG